MATAALELTSKISATGESVGNEPKQGGVFLPTQVTTPELRISVDFNYPGTPASARPSQVLFGAINDPRYRMLRPIPLDVTTEEGHVIVNWAEIDEFGTGETLSGAMDDFAHALRELNRYLLKNEELGPDLARIKHVLAEHLELRPR